MRLRTRVVSVELAADRLGAAALVLILLQLVVRLVVVLPSYYWQDDFTRLELSREQGLSFGLLLRDYNDHLEVIPSFLYWLLSHGPDRSFLLAGLLIVAMQLGAAVLFWRLLTTVFERHVILLVALAIYLFTPLALVTVTWFASAVEALSYQIVLFVMLIAQVRLLQTRRTRWAVVSVVAYAVGMLFWEKAAVILPSVVALLLLVVWRGVSFGERFRRLRRHRRSWAAHLLALLGFLALYFSMVDGSERVDANAAPYVRSAGTMLVQVFVPGIIGGPWHAGGAENTLYPRSSGYIVAGCLVVALAVVVASFWVSGRAAIGPWLMVVLYLGGDIGLLLWGRAYYLELVSRDPRYVADAVAVTALCLAAAFLPPVHRRPHRTRERITIIGVAVVPLLVASCLFTTSLLAPVVQRTYAHNYVDGLIDGFERRPGVGVVNTDVPPVIAPTDQRSLLSAVGFDAPFDQSSTEMWMFDSLANMRRIMLEDATLDRQGPVPDCGWPVRGRPVRLGYLPKSSIRGYVLRLGYVTGVPARLHVEVGGTHQSVDLTPGLGHAYVVVNGQSGDIRVWTRRTSVGICVSDIAAGKPWPRD